MLYIYSKKDDNLRVKELLSTVSDRFLQHVQENPHFWLSNGSIAMVLLGILKSGSGNLKYNTFISLLCTFTIRLLFQIHKHKNTSFYVFFIFMRLN